MHPVFITGTGLFTPSQSISNAELVEAFNAYALRWNEENAAAIADGSLQAIQPSSVQLYFSCTFLPVRIDS